MNQELTHTEAKQAMKPIIFSTPMVQAILAGRKTQTRRIVRKQPTKQEAVTAWAKGYRVSAAALTAADMEMDELIEKCPYGKVGDILYVRENYFQFGKWITEGITKKTKKLKWKFIPEDHDIMFTDKVDAMGETFQLDVKKSSYRQRAWYLRLARFMPKKYSRIFLKITDISVERLQDITKEDAIAEGVEKSFAYEYDTPDGLGSASTYGVGFKRLWGNINGPDSWEQNPWIWKITFERIEKP